MTSLGDSFFFSFKIALKLSTFEIDPKLIYNALKSSDPPKFLKALRHLLLNSFEKCENR